MEIGNLQFKPLEDSSSLVAKVIQETVAETPLSDFIYVAAINPELADTSSFCREYGVGLEISTNCLVIEAKRGDKVWYAACLVLANDRADVNGIIRRQLDARKTSFAPMDVALELTHMEYGGITPVGLPPDWPILVDDAIVKNPIIVVGGGVRSSKIVLKTDIFHILPNATVMKLVK